MTFDILKFIEGVGIGGVLTFIAAIFLRLQGEKAKNAKLETKAADNDITQKIHAESDSDIASELSKYLGPNNGDKPIF